MSKKMVSVALRHFDGAPGFYRCEVPALGWSTIGGYRFAVTKAFGISGFVLTDPQTGMNCGVHGSTKPEAIATTKKWIASRAKSRKRSVPREIRAAIRAAKKLLKEAANGGK